MSLLKKPPVPPVGPQPSPWPATAIIVIVVIAATVLVLTGHPAAAALGVVGGAGLAGVDIARRVTPFPRDH